MYRGKPIIGLVGGIGSGKSFVAKRFGELGCLVVDSDAQVTQAYRDPVVVQTIRGWWGEEVLHPDGTVNRSAIAARVFTEPAEKRRLEGLLHPMVHRAREALMGEGAENPQVIAYVWDTPLLLEAGLGPQCDAIVFVEAPLKDRVARVRSRGGWDEAELLRREKSQMPLDTKRALSDYVITNAADAGAGPLVLTDLREQVRRVLSQILTRPNADAEPRPRL